MKAREEKFKVMDITTGQAKIMTFDEYVKDLAARNPDFIETIGKIIDDVEKARRKFHEED